jgi:hypothetical protein
MKYECNACGIRICIAWYQSCSGIPFKCTAGDTKPQWHEVKEEAYRVSMQDNGDIIPDNKLPDWVKVGAIGYSNEYNDYFEIVDITSNFVRVNLFNEEYLLHGYDTVREHCIEARKRPFNEKEMKALVGKVIGWENNLELVISYNAADGDVYVDQMWCSAKYLMDNEYTIDGKPCYVLEHLEKGEWVE